MSYDFTPDDLPMLNTAMKAFPHVGDGLRTMVDLGNRLSFPVESPEQLQRAVGEAGTLRYADVDISLEDLPALMPAYYFPLESVEDFFAKVSDVTGRVREPDGRGMAVTRLREAVAQRRSEPPTITDDEIRDRLARDESSEENVRALIDLTLERGGTDNVTAVVGKTRPRVTPTSTEVTR